MEPERWRQIDRILQDVLERPAPERPAFLSRACAGDRELRAEVESLIAAHDRQDSFLEPKNLVDNDTSPLTEGTDPLPLPNDSFGPYMPMRVLGEGGMGTVYLAHQQHPIRRDVALKVVKAGTDSRQVIERFDIERQSLALMDHSNVARVLDAGTSDRGRPYFVMEYVNGVPITRYCDGKKLDIRERLRVFIPVCQALHHAHQRGIIHRDVKPSNILVSEVDGQPVPKVIDFGIARAIDRLPAEQETFTAAGQIIGTPEYMSPEQANLESRDIGTGTDVYSLGVVLYELLVGALPLDLRAIRQQGFVNVLRAVRETPAPKPTTKLSQLGANADRIAGQRRVGFAQLKRELAGDLDWIVMKAIDKDRMRRYASASEFAADIQRHLSNEPVLAGPPSAGYRVCKFVVRNKVPVLAAVVLVCSLIGGLVATTWQARLATRERMEADRQRVRAEQQAVESARQRDAAQAATRRASAAEARALQERSEALTEKNRADNEAAVAKAVNDFLQNDLLAQASANSQARPGTRPDPDLKVRTALDRAAARIAGKFDGQPLVEASIRMTIGKTYRELGQYPEAGREYERALMLRRRVLGEQHPDTLEAMDGLGSLYRDEGKYPQAEPLLAKALEVRRRVSGDGRPETLRAMNELATVYQTEGKYREAELLTARVLEVSRRIHGERDRNTMEAMHNLGLLYMIGGERQQAEALLSEAYDLYRKILGDDHPDTLIVMETLASLYRRQEKLEQAEVFFTRALEIRRRVLGAQHPDTLNAMNNLGSLYQSQGKYAQAESLHTKVLETRRAVLGEEHPDTLTAMSSLAMLYYRQGKFDESETLLVKTLAMQRRVLGGEHPATLSSVHNLGRLYFRQGRFAEAESVLTSSLDVTRRALGAQRPSTTTTLESLGEVRLQQRKFAEAETVLRQAVTNYEKLPDSWERHLAQSHLGASLAGQQKYAEAEPFLLSGYQGLVQREKAVPKDRLSEIKQAADRIVQLYRDWGKPEQAAGWQAKLVP
jgi:non-specific serine/threonine protein kinase/serine/threonine-protein kinase